MNFNTKSVVAALALLAAGVAPARAALVDTSISVYNTGSSAFIGYVSDVYDSQNSFTFTTNSSSALNVQINTSASSPFSILDLNPPLTNDYFAGVGGSGGYYFASNQDGYAYLSSSALTSAGAVPSSVATDLQSLGYNGPAESTVWSLNGKVLTAQWVNADSTTYPGQTFYDPVVNYIGLVGSLSTYNSTFGDAAYAVTLEATTVPEPTSLAVIGIPVAMALLRRRRTRV